MTAEEMLLRTRAVCLSAEAMWKTMWKTWPDGHCTVTSLLLAPILRGSVGYGFEVMVGSVEIQDEWQPHVWITTPEGCYIDPTYGQFMGYDDSPLLITRMGRGPRYEWKLILTSKEERYRRSIEPKHSSLMGWSAGSDLRQVLHPR